MTTPRELLLATCAAAGLSLASPVMALPVLWTLTDVEFEDFGIARGSFIYDADTNAFSSVAVTTSGGLFAGGSFADVMFGSAFDALLVPDATADLTGSPAFQLVFIDPLTNAGGFVDLTFLGDPALSSFEQTCFDAACLGAGIERIVVNGGLVGELVPLPAGIWLLISALGSAALLECRNKT